MTEPPPQDTISAVGPPPAPAAVPSDLKDPALYANRELSWIAFNERVLELAEDASQPLLERAKFAAIFTSNLDEFFMIRVAGVHDQVDAGVDKRGADGRTPAEVLDEIQDRVGVLSERQSRVVDAELRPALAEHGVRIMSWAQASPEQRAELVERYRRQIFPVLTPLAVGLGRPFPYISNLSLSLGVLVRDPSGGATTFARVKVPKEMLPRFVEVDAEPGTTALVPLEEVIAANLDALFPGMEVLDTGVFRVTRDADFEVSDEADDLLQAVEAELRRRRFGVVVRVEVDAKMPTALRDALTEALELEPRQLYAVEGLLDLEDLWQVVKLPGFPELRNAPWAPVTQPRLQGEDGPDILGEMRRGDLLVHHPYDSFSTSVERFVEQAATDPDVLAIKMTVYRTGDDSPLVPALIRATERGKQAVCLVELKARFDEQANIGWAPTSAARRRRCSNRWKARRASRASSRRSRPVSACTASRPRSTTPRPSPRCPGSFATAARPSSRSASRTTAAPRSIRCRATSSGPATTRFRSARRLPSCWNWPAECARAARSRP